MLNIKRKSKKQLIAYLYSTLKSFSQNQNSYQLIQIIQSFCHIFKKFQLYLSSEIQNKYQMLLLTIQIIQQQLSIQINNLIEQKQLVQKNDYMIWIESQHVTVKYLSQLYLSLVLLKLKIKLSEQKKEIKANIKILKQNIQKYLFYCRVLYQDINYYQMEFQQLISKITAICIQSQKNNQFFENLKKIFVKANLSRAIETINFRIEEIKKKLSQTLPQSFSNSKIFKSNINKIQKRLKKQNRLSQIPIDQSSNHKQIKTMINNRTIGRTIHNTRKSLHKETTRNYTSHKIPQISPLSYINSTDHTKIYKSLNKLKIEPDKINLQSIVLGTPKKENKKIE